MKGNAHKKQMGLERVISWAGQDSESENLRRTFGLRSIIFFQTNDLNDIMYLKVSGSLYGSMGRRSESTLRLWDFPRLYLITFCHT